MSQLQFLARRWGSAIPRRSVSSFFRATMHDQRGFTGAEKALLVCFGLAVVSGVGFLISEGGQKAAGDAKTTLTTQSGGTNIRLAGTIQAVPATAGSKAGPMMAANNLVRFSGDFQKPSPGVDFMPTGSIPGPKFAPAPAPAAAPAPAFAAPPQNAANSSPAGFAEASSRC